MPRADLVLFVTSADRPFTETERAFLEAIRGWGKKIVIVVNKIDIFERGEIDEVLTFVATPRSGCSAHAGDLSGQRAPGDARQAGRAGAGSAEPVRSARAIHPRDARRAEPVPAEAGEPARRGQALAHRYAPMADERLALLPRRCRLLEDIERQLAVYRTDIRRGFELRMTAVEKVLLDMEARGHAYFEDTLRLGRVIDLVNRAHGEGVRGAGRRRCAAADRAARVGADRLAGRSGLPPVAGGDLGELAERTPTARDRVLGRA